MIFLLGVGTIIGYKFTTKSSIDNIYNSSTNNLESDDVQIYDDLYKEDEKVSNVEPVSTKKYNIEVNYIDYYLLCDEEISNKKIHYDVDIDELKNEEEKLQEEENKTYQIVKENSEEICYKRVINTYCPNHYKVILENGKINIYSIITDESQQLYKTLEIPSKTLRNEVVDELTGGILVNSNEELKLIIEDIES
jgi:hypothetical protein